MQTKTFRWFVVSWFAVCVGALVLDADSAPLPAATQPALSDRQASILLQLADAEANIKVINHALVRTGYKVGLAYDRIESSEKANGLMDRNGGAPVRWDDFYGRTARDFYAPENVGVLHAQRIGASVDVQVATGYRPLERPPQFDFIYRANDSQVAKAREQIASLLQDQSALLARRHKHETEQSALWAELAWEQVRDREIAFRPAYRFSLKGDAARIALLRGPILFLRVANQAVGDGLDSIESNQEGTFDDVRARTKAAYATLQETMSTALLAPNVTSADASEAGDLKAVCKQITEECLVIDDNDRKADESDRANEDSSKLEYRGQLQSSLAKLAGLIAGLDSETSKAVADWVVSPQIGVDTPDKLPPAPPRPPAAAPIADPAPNPLPAPIVGAPSYPLASLRFSDDMGYTIGELFKGTSTHNNDDYPLTEIPSILVGKPFTKFVGGRNGTVRFEFMTRGKIFILAQVWSGYPPQAAILRTLAKKEDMSVRNTKITFEVWSITAEAGKQVYLPFQEILVADHLEKVEQLP